MYFLVVDTETRGIFGDIFRWRAYDGESFADGYTAKDLSEWLACFTEPSHIYIHNLEFDLSKVLKAKHLRLDLDESMLIGRELTMAKFQDSPITLHCSWHILRSSLAFLSSSFGLEEDGKMDLKGMIHAGTLLKPSGKPYKTIDEYFRLVHPDDPLLNSYLDRDCISLHKILQEVMEFAQLEEKFFKIMTTPQLSMSVFRTRFPKQYKMLTTQNSFTDEQEAFFRQSYKGANTQMFIPRLLPKADKPAGYHYDFNSLYPYVMESNTFPIGRFREETEPQQCATVWRVMQNHPEHYPAAIIEATVTVPASEKYPVLPLHADGRLMFLTGTFRGTWILPEFLYAIERGLKIETFHRIAAWYRVADYFSEFIGYCKIGKLTSTGGKREFYKGVMNKGYGKIGMNRIREVYLTDTEANREQFIEEPKAFDSELFGRILQGEIEIPRHECRYVNPHVAAYITGYARLELIKLIHYCQATKRKVYYCDTDSAIVDKPLPPHMTDSKEFGKLKLEGVLKSAVFLQPKMYAESFWEPKMIDGQEIWEDVKGKGIPADILKSLSYTYMVRTLEKIEAGEQFIQIFEGFQERRKVISAAKHNVDIDEPFIRRKGIDASYRPKRKIDYAKNDSMPWSYQELTK